MLLARSWRAALVGGSAVIVLTVVAPGAAASASRQCGLIRASVPYAHRGDRDRWRVYVTGNTSCGSARRALNAVMHLDATQHVGQSDADSFFAYRGWHCPFGNMGFQSCVRPFRRPYRARALAVDCAIVSGGCPRRAPPGFFS